MSMEEILILLAVFCFGWWLRGLVISILLKRQLDTAIHKIVKTAANKDKSEIVNRSLTSINLMQIYYDRVGDSYYLYKVSDNSFICQGGTLEEAARNYSKHNSSIACYSDPYNSDNSFFIVSGKMHHTIDSGLLGNGAVQ